MKPIDVSDLACKIASHWHRQRLDSRVTQHLDPTFMRLLDELQRLTLGDVRRCSCIAFRDSGGRYHDIQCLGRPRST